MPRSSFVKPGAKTIDWLEDRMLFQRRTSSTTLEDMVQRGCTPESTESQPQCCANAGRTPSFYAYEPGPDPRVFLRPPKDGLDRDDELSLFCSTFFQLQEQQLERGGKVKSG
ncbi:hypothetical protein MRX96_025035 [Rhipicephalus microplus]